MYRIVTCAGVVICAFVGCGGEIEQQGNSDASVADGSLQDGGGVTDGGPRADAFSGEHADGATGDDAGTGDACVGVDCSGHGVCTVVGGEPQCTCEPYYRPEGLSCVLDPSQLQGFVVAPNGDDANPGTWERPFRTIGHGVSRLGPGDTLWVREGVYVEAVTIAASGAEGAPLRVLAVPGERPVIDGDGRLPSNSWNALLHVSGDSVEVAGFEVRNSSSNNGLGVKVSGRHSVARHLDVHHNHQQGILLSGDGSVVEYSRIWQNGLVNADGVCQPEGTTTILCTWPAGISAARDYRDGITDNAVLRGNVVFNNWGEGLSTFEAQGTLIEDNIVFNNWSVNLYISDAWNVRAQRNLVFVTDDTPIVGARRFPSNISLMDEVATARWNPSVHPRSHDNVVINNLVLGTRVCLMCWSSDEAVQDGAGLRNLLFAHNTIVDATLVVGEYANSGSRVVNNIFSEGTELDSRPGIEFRSNLAGDPGLVRNFTFSNTDSSVEFFKLTPLATEAIDAGEELQEVSEDFFRGVRGALPDIGAHEFKP